MFERQPIPQVIDFINLTEVARRTGRFPQLVDSRSSVNGLLLTVSPGFRAAGGESADVWRLKESATRWRTHPTRAQAVEALDQLLRRSRQTRQRPSRQPNVNANAHKRHPSGISDQVRV